MLYATKNFFLNAHLFDPLCRVGGVEVNHGTEECEFEIQYLGIQLFCHTQEKPAFYMGKGHRAYLHTLTQTTTVNVGFQESLKQSIILVTTTSTTPS